MKKYTKYSFNTLWIYSKSEICEHTAKWNSCYNGVFWQLGCMQPVSVADSATASVGQTIMISKLFQEKRK